MATGIFCIENWSANLASKDSVLPLLQFIEQRQTARTIHQQVDTPRILRHYLYRFSDLRQYPICYLALHGSKGHVDVGNQSLSLKEFISWFYSEGREPGPGAPPHPDDEWVFDFSNKVLYFGSCSSLKVDGDDLAEIRYQTVARAVFGYTEDVDWYESAGFHVLLLSSVAEAMSKGPAALPAAIKRLRRRSGSLMETLGFTCDPKWPV